MRRFRIRAATGALALMMVSLVATPGLRAASSPDGAHFALIDQNGTPFTEQQLAGVPYALTFGYTFCPDVCPTTLFELTDVLTALGDAVDDLKVVFVTVDPTRDTSELLRNYLGAFHPRITALTGPQSQIDALVEKHNVYVQRMGEGESYTFNHTAAVLLFGRDGKLADTLAYQAPRDEQIAKLRRLVAR